MRSPATDKHNRFSFWLLRNDGALECLAVLNDVVPGRKRWNSRADDNKNDGEGRDFHGSSGSIVPLGGTQFMAVSRGEFNRTALES
jgi:hypothetical protein